MFKKFLIASSVFVVTTGIAVASGAPYVGASLGIVTNTSSKAPSSPTLTKPANFRGVPLNVFVGFGGMMNQYIYLAGEVFSTVATSEISNNNGLKTSYSYGASVLPGVMLSDHTLAFARAGLVRSHFSNANQSLSGGQLGIGLQTTLTQNVDIRGEYDFTAYRSFNNKFGRVSAPRSDAFNLGVLYKFS